MTFGVQWEPLGGTASGEEGGAEQLVRIWGSGGGAAAVPVSAVAFGGGVGGGFGPGCHLPVVALRVNLSTSRRVSAHR